MSFQLKTSIFFPMLLYEKRNNPLDIKGIIENIKHQLCFDDVPSSKLFKIIHGDILSLFSVTLFQLN